MTNRRDHQPQPTNWKYVTTLSVGALGVVFGDIGTSPLYALRECFHGPHALPLTLGNVLGILSLIVWSLVLVISVKYLIFVMRADNKGEGGVLALMALAAPGASMLGKRKERLILLMGLFGSALLYGDGIITPAITVLGAVEGLEVATPVLSRFVVPISIVILTAIFLPQSRGTARIGAIFGPVLLIWFAAIALLGIRGIAMHPGLVAAVNPIHAIRFLTNNGWHGFLSLGVVFLVVTGGEALYADMGHFGRKPIRLSWYLVVLPSLLLNYLGQGAIILSMPDAVTHPFFKLAPTWALYPLVGLSTLAAIIASQALISGAYSLTRQAVSLGYLPRMTITHTSREEIGQIYVPFVNWSLLFACIWLVLFFSSSSAMASAYGIAVTTTMVITTALTFFVTHDRWGWKLWQSLLATVPFFLIDIAFFSASITKIAHGGWFPLLVGISILMTMTTWRRGRMLLAERLRQRAVPIEQYARDLQAKPPTVVPGTAIYMTSALDGVPPALIHNVKHNKVIHERVVIMTVSFQDIPYVSRDERLILAKIDDRFWTLRLFFGFMDTPNVPAVLMRVATPDLPMGPGEVTYFMGRETVLATHRPGMAIWRERLFSFMSRNAQRATAFFRIPPGQVLEIGIQIEL